MKKTIYPFILLTVAFVGFLQIEKEPGSNLATPSFEHRLRFHGYNGYYRRHC